MTTEDTIRHTSRIESTSDRDPAIPMTAAQRGIFYAQQLEPDVPLTIDAYIEFRGDTSGSDGAPVDIDPEILQRATTLTELETEASMLRLTPTDDAEPTLTIDRSRRLVLGTQDFSDAADPRAAALAWIDDHRSKSPDMFSDPLLDTHLLKIGPGHSIWYCRGHHIGYDGYAAMYLMLRVSSHYTAIVNDAPPPLADTATMAEIASMDVAYRASEKFLADREYWSQHLADLPESATLTRRSGPAAPLSTVRSAVLADDLVNRIRSLARAHRVRPASVITAAVAAYVARFTDRDEAVLSLPVAARDRDILRTSAGLISNVVPLRVVLDDDATVADLLASVNAEIKNAVRHQKFRHEDIVADILGAAGARRGFFGPLVNVMLFFQHIDFGPVHGELNVLSTGPIEDLSVNVYDSLDGGMSVDLEANPNIYSDDEIVTHHRRLVEFLEALVTATPETTVSHVSVLRECEAAELPQRTTGAHVELGERTLVDLLDEAAAAHPEAPVLVAAHPRDPAESSPLSHAEFARRTRSLAAALQDRGIGAESVVAVQLRRGLDQVLALHAVVRAGAAFVPVDPDEPADRLEHILAVAAPDLIIGEASLAELRANPDRRDPVTVAGPDNTAYLLFTSGSTGKPKGVAITHRAIVNRLGWMQARYPLNGSDRVLQKTPATFDVSVWEFFWPFVTGAALVVPSADGHRDPWYLRDVIDEHRITTVHFVPSMLTAFSAALSADADTPGGAHRRATTTLGSLRQIFTSGEALTPGTVGATAALTSAPIHNLYGPTEAAIDVTHHDACRADVPVVPIGRPVWNTSVHVLDHRLRPQPPGAVGELYLGGVQLARGYRARPDLTAARFIASPDGSGERLYRTGDLVRMNDDGELEYLGRTDSQVKIRGQRVELGEIESALGSLHGVAAAGVLVRDDLVADGPVLVGYVSGAADLHTRELRTELASALPGHMIPTVVMVLDELPTTANGKLDRRALPRPELRTDREFVAPETALDRFVVRTVADVLGLDPDPTGSSPISLRDDFFAIGGSSLSATRVASRLSKATGRRIGIRTIFDAEDIGGIVDALTELGVGVDDSPGTTSPRTGSPVLAYSPVPLSPAQHRLWLATRLDPAGAATYNMPFTVRLVGSLDTDALRQALTDVIVRHEPLRSVVVEKAGIAFMSPRSPDTVTVDLPVLRTEDVRDLPDREFAAQTFDLGADLPIRARLVRTSDDDHRLTVVVHHIAADGWSLAPLAGDLATAYRARREGNDPDWAALPVTYSQVSADRHAWLSESADATAELDFWRATLADAPGETDLPLDRPRTGRGDASGASVTHTVSTDTHRAIRELAADTGSTVFMVLHAAVAALLRSLSRSSDVVVGTPVAGRGDADLDGLVGMFVNTLALRTKVDKDAGFVDLLTHVRDVDLNAFDNAGLPFDRLVTELNPDRSSHVHPFFQVSLALEDRSAIRLDFAGLAATASRVDTGHTTFDLQLTFTEAQDTDGEPAGIGLEIAYATALFDRSTVTALSSRLDRLLQAATAQPRSAVGDLPVLDLHERLDLVPAVGEGRRPVEHLTTLLSTAAASSPNRIAITDGTRSLTYRDLDAASNRLARLLIERGAGPERHVAVALPRGVDWMIAMWAVTRSGAAWVPVDPAYPPARIAHMLTDSGSCLLLTDRSADPRPALADESSSNPGHLPQILALDDGEVIKSVRQKSAAPVSSSERPGPLDVDQPAYLIYTSGTTGTPKGVVVGHRGLADFGAQQVTQYGITPDSQTMHMASPSFDATVLEILMAIAAGSTMHIIPPGIVGGAELAELMREGHVTHAFLTPSVLTTMSPDDVPELEALVIGGEHPNPEVVRTWSSGPRLFNAYGPTETTVVAAVSAPIEPDYTTLTIGRPIRGVSALVLDERLRPVAPGAIGELYIAGEHLARGYHGVRPLTSKRFIANPFGDPGERMYRTGDLVRWTTDHELEFRGRADHQTKIRGHRIELGEIDAVLVSDAAVRATVTTTRGEGDRAHLVSYVTMAHGTSDTASDVRERLSDRLPRHMIPSAIVELDEIPTTPIGKVDLRALPAPETLPANTGVVYVAPITPIEQTVADLITERLDLEPGTVGRHHDFFDLGGNSLLATQIVGALEHLTGHRIPVREVFDNSTVAAIARLVPGRETGRSATDETRIPRLVHDPDAPVEPGPAQQQLWFLNQLAIGEVTDGDGSATAGYAIAFALDLRGRLDVDALATAIRRTVDRHVMLRTVYPDLDGRPVLDVRPADAVTLDLAVTDTTEAQWPDLARALAGRPFDLTTDLPLRTALHRIDGDTMHHRLSIVIHHIAADGWSMIPLHRDITRTYAELGRGDATETDRPDTAIDYLDYLRWQAENLADHGELAEWWRRELDGVDAGPILIPDAPAGQTRRAEVVEVEFGAEIRRRLMAVSPGRATEFMSVHALFAALLHRLHADPATHVGGAASDIVIGTPVAGRNDPRLADVVGMFVNSVVLRTPVDGRESFTALLDSVRHRDLEALSQSDMPFERIVSMVNPPRTGRHPIFQIALAFDAQTSDASTGIGTSGPLDGDSGISDLRIDADEIDTGVARFDLELRIRDGRARFTYATDVHTRARVEALARMFAELADAATAHPDVPIDDLPLTTTAIAARQPNTEPTITPRHLADIITATARRFPDRVAVEDSDRSLTYSEIDEFSTIWAHNLQAFAVGTDDVVAVALDRSIESVIATWAIAKSGAAILPVDTRYPADRIAHMIADSGARLGITTADRFADVPQEIWWASPGMLGVPWENPTPDADSLTGPRHVDSLAYVVYTSGSTGKPKGVSVTHRGLAAFAAAQRDRYRVAPGDRTLHFASPAFDAAMLEFLLAFEVGATMVIVPSTIYGGDELVDFLDDHAVTHAFITPAALATAAPHPLPALRTLGVGGEASTPELVARWGADRSYINSYGPTETTIVAVMSEPLRPGTPITIGTPVVDCTALVLDHRLRPVPAHVPGELYISGPGVARGYLDRRGPTAARFVARPGGSGDVMYRTGDIVRRDADGSLIYHGRSDNQVKVRGFRIELDEVTAALSAAEGVDFATTVVRGQGADAALVGYVTSTDQTDAPDTAAILDTVRQRLPRQMVPSAIVVLDSIPLTGNGKLDHRALPDPATTAPSTSGRAPCTPAETALTHILADVLDLRPDEVGATDDFFLLGGTSLQATTLVSRINRVHTGERLRVRDVFDHPTPEALAPLLVLPEGWDMSAPAAADVISGSIEHTAPKRLSDRPERFPLAPAQRRLHSMATANPESTEYLMPFVLHLHGELDVPALRGALVDIVARHTSLRTVFEPGEHGPKGRVLDDPEAVIGDLTVQWTTDVAVEIARSATRPMDLTRHAPITATLVADSSTTGSETEHVLVLVLHHIAADGASLPILVADLTRAYGERRRGRTENWTPADVDYRDHALASADAESLADDLRFWEKTLADAPAETTVAPLTDDAPPSESGAGSVSLRLPAHTRAGLVAFAREQSTTPFSVLHTALAILLNRLGLGDDLVVGSPVANRIGHDADQDYSGVVGMFVNVVPLRTRLAAADTVAGLVRRVRDADVDALDHRGLPFDDIVASLNPPRTPGRHPLFQVALSVHDYTAGNAGVPADGLPAATIEMDAGLRASIAEFDSPEAKFDLQFTLTGMRDGDAALQVTYDTARYRRQDAELLATRLMRVVRGMLGDPGRPIGDIRITDPLEVAERTPSLGRPAQMPTTLDRLFAQAVQRNPDGVAAMAGSPESPETITYAELDARSNRLARVLLGRGVGAADAEHVVAMAVQRSIESLVAIWAIVKTGAAYVPIDPTYPADRIAHMLGDSGARLVVTTAAAGESIAAGMAGDPTPLLVLDDASTMTRLQHSSPSPITDSERGSTIRPDQLAYIIYTSGSTGRPKGVLVPHSGLRPVHDELAHRMAPGPMSRVLHFASPSFDASVLEMLLALAGSAPLVIVGPQVYGGEALSDVIDSAQVTHAFITPAAVASMSPAAVPSLRALAVGGEDYGADLVRRWAPGRTLINVYGPTETTIIITGSESLTPNRQLTIGTPNNGVGALVLDERLHPVPAGVVGELYLMGPQITRGYHRRPGLTSTRFVPAPMVTGPRFAGRRMYRTGDLVRWTEDGRLVYVGRGDTQVQVRGFRIELGEIDDALTTEPDVDFAVTLVDGTGAAAKLRSYVTATDGAAPEPADLRRRVSRRLPRHMVPTSVTLLDSIPLTPTGKLDRKALPASTDDATRRAPAPGEETTIAQVFAEVLEVAPDTIGADDGFFDLGGNSLLATAVTARLTERTGRQVSAQSLFGAPSPAELAAALGIDGAAPTDPSEQSGTAGLDMLLPLRRQRGDTTGNPGEPPLFVVHPAIGLSWSFTSLLPHLPAGRALYGLQHPALSGKRCPRSIGDLAADYVAQIRTVAPEGPYHLVGWSLGGLIAHEMAVQLREAGDEVARLVVLDSYVISERPDLDAEASITDLMREFGLDLDSEELSGTDELTVADAHRIISSVGGALGGLARDTLGTVHEVFRHASPLAEKWRPRVYDGDLSFVTATVDPQPGAPAVEAWYSKVTGRVVEIESHSTHARMMLPENVSDWVHAIGVSPGEPASATRQEK
ncbi:amino acid adenylation domain-containing protein [Gordonia alkanivorans]|uniref:non-ribosomal peptide synthetase n=2 Tax=Gordonia alkanivorans TaxID=84096 RepID=UPI0024B801FA|nr:non-ribosomal peptide synthetase [Gordonia alkanivorans]MDJ0007864.1 amino acid adenylation domain-containing protein [Gordonia alkanivorans]MDJ0096513.1 amino acid adenylation domain-containing protein [Gordonia alkanivorans]MDJ0493190.1 amino acid adenylation domain-containing protein [Gordonia alkanivorans]